MNETRRGPSFFQSLASLAFDALPGSGLARVAFEQMRARIRADLEDELEELKFEREKDQDTISRLTDVIEKQQLQLEKAVNKLTEGR